MEAIPGRGVKRKYIEEDYYAWQRKSIIDVSMCKLRTSSSQRSEPCLRRSVLILNTLKQIETELAREGLDTHRSSEAAINEIPEMSVSQLTLDPLPDISTFIYPLPMSSPVPMSAEGQSGVEREGGDYLSVVDLLPCKPLTGCSQQAMSQASPGYPSSTPLESATHPVSHSYYSDSSDTPMDSESLSHSQSSTVYYGLPSPDVRLPEASLYNTFSPHSAFDEPKVYDAEASNVNFTTLGPYHMNNSCSVGEDSLSEAEVIDLLHSLQEAADCVTTPGSPNMSATASVPVLNAQCSTYCRTDSTLDDLDSIMQILVGI